MKLLSYYLNCDKFVFLFGFCLWEGWILILQNMDSSSEHAPVTCIQLLLGSSRARLILEELSSLIFGASDLQLGLTL